MYSSRSLRPLSQSSFSSVSLSPSSSFLLSHPFPSSSASFSASSSSHTSSSSSSSPSSSSSSSSSSHSSSVPKLYRPPEQQYARHGSDYSFLDLPPSRHEKQKKKEGRRSFQLHVESERHVFTYRIRQYHQKLMQRAVEAFELSANKFQLYLSSVVPLRTHFKKWTFLRSPFVHKSAREQLEKRTHFRLVSIEIDPQAPLARKQLLMNNALALAARTTNVSGPMLNYEYRIPAHTPIRSAVFVEAPQLFENEDEDDKYSYSQLQALKDVMAQADKEYKQGLQDQVAERLLEELDLDESPYLSQDQKAHMVLRSMSGDNPRILTAILGEEGLKQSPLSDEQEAAAEAQREKFLAQQEEEYEDEDQGKDGGFWGEEEDEEDDEEAQLEAARKARSGEKVDNFAFVDNPEEILQESQDALFSRRGLTKQRNNAAKMPPARKFDGRKKRQ